jgi:phosphoglycerol transferase
MLELAFVIAVVFVAVTLLRLGCVARLGKGLATVALLLFTGQTVIQFAAYAVAGNGFNEAVFYHLVYGLEGAGIGQFRLVILRAVGVLVLWSSFVWAMLYWKWLDGPVARRFPSNALRTRLFRYAGVVLTFGSVVAHPLMFDAWKTFHPSGKVQPMLDSYVVPSKLKARPELPNFVFLYLESLERTYFDESIFPGVINHLRQWESQSLTFTNVAQTYGTGWTIAGMVATQCGIPLIPKTVDFSMIEEQRPDRNDIRGSLFLPGATCMGDLLQEAGYRTVYMGGASGAFAGKANFYRTHGFHETHDKRDLIGKLPDGARGSWWGLFDDQLYSLVGQRFEELYAAGKPFALVSLTLDTHGGTDHVYSPSCVESPPFARDNLNLRAVACTDQLVNDLIRRIRQIDTRHNTYIVVLSDHLAMENTATALLKQGTRRNLFFINAPDGSLRGINNRAASTLSTGVTILDAAGFDVAALGLGRSLLRSEKTLEERLGEGSYNAIVSWSSEFRKFWDFSRVARRKEREESH